MLVLGLVKRKLVSADDVELSSPASGNEIGPFIHRRPADAEHSTYSSLRAVMFDDISFAHMTGRYLMGHRDVNDGIPVLTPSLETMDETKGDRIRRLREARGLTQPALAKLLVSMGAPATLEKAAVAKWESGDTQNMKNETFILLCRALGTDPEYILWGQDRAPPESVPFSRSKRKA